jgi:hypothetical protein
MRAARSIRIRRPSEILFGSESGTIYYSYILCCCGGEQSLQSTLSCTWLGSSQLTCTRGFEWMLRRRGARAIQVNRRLPYSKTPANACTDANKGMQRASNLRVKRAHSTSALPRRNSIWSDAPSEVFPLKSFSLWTISMSGSYIRILGYFSLCLTKQVKLNALTSPIWRILLHKVVTNFDSKILNGNNIHMHWYASSLNYFL